MSEYIEDNELDDNAIVYLVEENYDSFGNGRGSDYKLFYSKEDAEYARDDYNEECRYDGLSEAWYAKVIKTTFNDAHYYI